MNAFSNSVVDSPNGWAADVTARYAPGGNPGNTFDVQGLSPWPGEASIGTITIVTDETLTDADVGVDFGMPRDLDDDGVVDNLDVSATARVLPVVVRLRWNGPAGQRELEQGFFLLGL